ncbi:PH domain-containing protein [Shewanella colwelliana]|uniref:YdbS-like PH domain-containing protein n=1 Tax=Shewanella colwelliana TaxID=23 RepID=A0A1E5IR91_SHECO|nr:PH domain-containing protein [Shewanella colwelliana]MDX1281765.1 PH domain-containing protein [Shewanella colwelliana]OEG73051.1 hypothetical protein BEL05_06550 [Shewanella colwelliana]
MDPVNTTPTTENAPNRVPLAEAAWLSFDQVALTPVEPSYIKQVQLENLVFIPLLIAPTVFGFLISLPALALISLVTGLLLLALIISFGRIRYAKTIAYAVCEHEIIMEKGLLWHKRISLPYTRLQHVSLSQGPLERHFNQHTLKCFSAGSGSAEITLPGIQSDTAESLRQHLLAKAALNQGGQKTATTQLDPLVDQAAVSTIVERPHE